MVNIMPKYYSRRPNGSFKILKQIDGERFYFGTYKTEEEAQWRVEFLKAHNWNRPFFTKCTPKHYSKVKNGKYVVYKTINKRIYNFGRYDTEQEAMDMVDFLKRHDWDLRYAHIHNPETKHIVKFHGKYQIRRINNDTGKIEHYGTFSTLEEAQAERDLYVRCNWDWNLICDGGL